MASKLVEKFTKTFEVIERRKIVFPVSEREAIYAELAEWGWKCSTQGPYTTKRMFPKTDPSRMMMVIERLV